MALLGNQVLANKTVNYYTSGATIAQTVANSFSSGRLMNRFATMGNLCALPEGANPPVSWSMARDAGSMSSSRAAQINFTQTGNAVLGKPISGESTITLTATGTGGLVVSGSGTASFSITAAGTLISIAAAQGSASINLNVTGTMRADAYISGNATIVISGTAGSYAIGYLSGTASTDCEFSPEALAAAVWQALATSYNDPGTMGNVLNSAGSAGDPWITNLPGAYPTGSAGDIVGAKLLRLAQFLGLKDA